MTTQTQIPSDKFLSKFGRYILVSQDGSIRFTSAGKSELFGAFVELGIDYASIRTVGEFRSAMRSVLAADAARLDQQAEALVRTPGLSSQDRSALTQFFGMPTPVREPQPSGVVHHLDFTRGG